MRGSAPQCSGTDAARGALGARRDGRGRPRTPPGQPEGPSGSICPLSPPTCPLGRHLRQRPSPSRFRSHHFQRLPRGLGPLRSAPKPRGGHCGQGRPRAAMRAPLPRAEWRCLAWKATASWTRPRPVGRRRKTPALPWSQPQILRLSASLLTSVTAPRRARGPPRVLEPRVHSRPPAAGSDQLKRKERSHRLSSLLQALQASNVQPCVDRSPLKDGSGMRVVRTLLSYTQSILCHVSHKTQKRRLYRPVSHYEGMTSRAWTLKLFYPLVYRYNTRAVEMF